MVPTIVPFSSTVSAFNNNATLFSMPTQPLFENIFSYESKPLTAKEISQKVIEFMQQVTLFTNEQELKSLKDTFEFMTQDMPQDLRETVQQALIKPEGYLHRLFSNESWENWSERRTSLGKVVDVCVSYIESETHNNEHLLNKLDSDIISEANIQAYNLIEKLRQLKNHKLSVASTVENLFSKTSTYIRSLAVQFDKMLSFPVAEASTLGNQKSKRLNVDTADLIEQQINDLNKMIDNDLKSENAIPGTSDGIQRRMVDVVKRHDSMAFLCNKADKEKEKAMYLYSSKEDQLARLPDMLDILGDNFEYFDKSLREEIDTVVNQLEKLDKTLKNCRTTLDKLRSSHERLQNSIKQKKSI